MSKKKDIIEKNSKKVKDAEYEEITSEEKDDEVTEEDIEEKDSEIDEESTEELESETEDKSDEELDSQKEDEELIEESDEETEDDETFESNPVKRTMSDKTRYIIIAVVTVLLLALIVVIIIFGNTDSNNSSSNSNNTSNVSSDSNTSSKKERNTSTDVLKEFYKEFDSEDLNVIFFARSTCGYCNLEKPILKQIAKDYDIDYYDIDTDKISTTETSEIMSALNIEGYTPTTVIVKEGNIVATQQGYLDGQDYVDFFSKNGILKENSKYKPEENLKRVNYSEFKSKAKEKDYNLLLLDTSACSACIEVRSMLSDMAKKYKIEVNYLSGISQTDANTLINTDLKEWGYSDETYKKESTVNVPLLLVTKDNKIVDYVLESTEESDYTKVLKKYKFIK